MRKLLLVLALLLAPVSAWAQCNGIFPATTVCGSIAGGPPGPVPFGTVSGVTNLNGLFGAISVIAGANVTVTVSGQDIIIASTGGGGGGGGVTSINAVTGAVTIVGSGLTVTPSGSNVTISTGTTQFVTAAGAVTVASSDGYIFMAQSSPAPAVINLPAASSRPTNLELTIKDALGVAAAGNTFTITANGSDTIDGAATLPITFNYQSFTLIPVSSTRWAIK